MKKILCMILALLMTVPFMAFAVSADGEGDGAGDGAGAAPDAYSSAEDGALLYTANFNGDSRWAPSAATAAANAGYNWACEDVTVTPDAQDSGKATIAFSETINSAWGADISDLPLGEGYAYTVKYTVTRTTANNYIGLLIDGHHGPVANATRMRVNKNGSGIGADGSKDNSYVEYSSLSGVTIPGTVDVSEANPSIQEYAVEVNGNTGAISVYVKNTSNKWAKIMDRTLSSETRDHLGLYFFSYQETSVTVSDVLVYKGIAVLSADLATEEEVEEGGAENSDNSPSADSGVKKENKAPVLVEKETEAETEAETAEETGGCGSSIGFGGVALVLTSAIGMIGVRSRRDKDEEN